MPVTELSFTPVYCLGQLFVKTNIYTKFHEIPTDGVAAASRPHMDLHIRHCFVYFKWVANHAVSKKWSGPFFEAEAQHFFSEDKTLKPSLGGPGGMLQFKPRTLQM